MADAIRLIGYSGADLLALRADDEGFASRLGLRPSPGLGAQLRSPEVSPAWLASLRDSTDADPWTLGFGIVHVETMTVIGSAAFKGPPDAEGMVEIAYGVVPQHEGKGYATQAAARLVAYARRDARVRLIRAHTLPTNGGSVRVLEKNGFRFVGEVEDPEDGIVWRWERAP